MSRNLLRAVVLVGKESHEVPSVLQGVGLDTGDMGPPLYNKNKKAVGLLALFLYFQRVTSTDAGTFAK